MTEIISIFALVISGISLWLSFHFGYRDKAILKIQSRFTPFHSDYDRAHINIKIVNAGRRPTILKLFGGDTTKNGYHATFLNSKQNGLRLDEHEMHEENVYANDMWGIDPDGEEWEYTNLWFEDTLGQRHKVKNSEKTLRLLKQSQTSKASNESN
jgi:hypothetical protein